MQEPYMIVRKHINTQMIGQLCSILQIHFFRFFYQRAYDIHLISLCHLFIQKAVQILPFLFSNAVGLHLLTPRRQLVNDRQVHITI